MSTEQREIPKPLYAVGVQVFFAEPTPTALDNVFVQPNSTGTVISRTFCRKDWTWVYKVDVTISDLSPLGHYPGIHEDFLYKP
ncbi:hypothetical protein CC2G_007122 [Coprinopsis cinerea AmutBmut pab1-1]|nr:hypothetical protein CC2G_007122 [Coprinopsis cinerea AmutBmut pab1-1]